MFIFLLTEIASLDSKNNNLNFKEEKQKEIKLEMQKPHNLHSDDEKSSKLDNSSTKSPKKSEHSCCYLLTNYLV